ncbi:MAG: hypothetical protein HY925_06535 [Elusimicrobia bacterium]|nr:hypothetical protein [Elusimicrobiota bacterium]
MKRHLPAALAFAALSILATWPLARFFTIGVLGDGDPWQWLWGYWWWHEALFSLGRSPFFTDRLFWPNGVNLWFECFDIPSTILALPLWHLLPEVSIINATLWLTYPAAGLAFYFLAAELWGGGLAAFLAGCLYTFSAFHFAEGSAHQHLSSIEWTPLYFLGLLRMLRLGGARDAALAAVALALATLATPYHLLFCFVGTAVLFACWSFDPARAKTLWSRKFWALAFPMAGGYLLLAGWFLAGMALSAAREPIVVPHAPELLSADLVNFFVPNPTSAWAGPFGAFIRRWTCKGAEAEAYLGCVLVLLACRGAWKNRAARPFLAAAVAGALLALGPYLHVGGEIYRAILLPYGWLVRAVPGLSVSGCPNKFSGLVAFALACAAGAALAELCRSKRGRNAAVALTALAVLEVWPKPLVLQTYAAPDFLRAMASEPGEFAVLDVSHPLRALWNGVLHRRPQPGGYITRPPASALKSLEEDPALRPFMGAWPAGAKPVTALRRVDAAIDLNAETAAAMPAGWSQTQWVGAVRVSEPGDYRFYVEADEYAALWIDGRPAVGGPGTDEREGRVRLAPGEHGLRLLYRKGESGRVRLSWRPPSGARALLDAAVLRTPDGKPGLTGDYLRFDPDLGMPADAMRGKLAALKIRYVITDGWRRAQVLALGIPLAYSGGGIEVYRLP